MVDETPRLGLPIYTSGTDLHPTREDFNARMELLEEAVAIARQGTRDDRPMPSTRGTLFMETDTGVLWFDTGSEWIRVVRIGNDGPGRALNIDGAGAEGSSEWAARADHVHPLPLATASQPGALSADDKAKLDAATSAATSNAIARRNGSGQMSTAEPSATGHATNKSYVDREVGNHSHSTSDIDRGVFDRDRIPKSTLHYGNTIVDRDDDGRIRVSSPVHINDAATKVYVDSQITGHTHTASDVDRGTFAPARLPAATASQQGAMSAADKRKLDEGTSALVNSALVRRSANGRINIASPINNTEATNKSYVDDAVYTRASSSHTHAASDVSSGTLLPARLPAATQSAQGAMSAEDKELLDGATTEPNGGTVVRRNSSGRASVGGPVFGPDIANKEYVDNALNDALAGSINRPINMGDGDLNDRTTPGYYFQVSSQRARPEDNYPDDSPGALVVILLGGGSRMQEYVTIHGDAYRRRYQAFNDTWAAWSQVGS